MNKLLPSTLVQIVICIILSATITNLSYAMVSYDEGRLEIEGVQLFQHYKYKNSYYYLPQYPRISTDENGNLDFLCIKYVGSNLEQSGGLFHTLFSFDLDAEKLKSVKESLIKLNPEAVIVGPVDLQHDSEKENSFRIVSSILNEESEGLIESNIISSGKAPFLPGSKAAISCLLNTKAATLLWNTFEGETSDVSIVVEGFFSALVTGFSANVSANLEIVYDHFSSFENKQSGYKKEQISNVLDSLAQTGDISIDIVDMSEAYDVNIDLYKNLLEVITSRVTSMMFNTKEGWAKIPTVESAIDSDDGPGRFKRDAVTNFIMGSGHQMYIPDNQLLLKEKKLIRSFNFSMTIDQSTAIKIPVYSAGNLGGVYKAHGENENYFRVVDMDDAAFQEREIYFQINGIHSDCFKNGFDNATVRFKKTYQDKLNNDFTDEYRFNAETIDSGKLIKLFKYKRLSEPPNHWMNYQYKVSWNLADLDTTLVTDWTDSEKTSISIVPPLVRKNIIIDLDRELMDKNDIQSARIRFGIKLLGKSKMTNMKVLRKSDSLSTDEIVLYHDSEEPVVYQVNWYSKGKEIRDEVKMLEDDYLFLVLPEN